MGNKTIDKPIRTKMSKPILIALDHLTPATTLGLSTPEPTPESTAVSAPDGTRPTDVARDATVDAPKNVPAQVEVGEMLTVVVVMAANVVRDIRENLRNLVGGRMGHYERLVQGAIDAALTDLQAKAHAKGYDGVVGVKICHPNVVEGGVEVIVYGNGFWLRPQQADGAKDERPN
jgi:uncharacterized protein YbjQ (UPF0145 family)